MKNPLTIVLIALTLFSCNNESIIRVSGELIGGIKDTLIFENKITQNKFKAPVNESGKFSAEFQSESGYYYLRSNSNQVLPGIDIFLQSKQETIISIKTENWIRERQYNMINSPENEYLINFRILNNDFRRKNNLAAFTPVRVEKLVDSLHSELERKLNELIKSNKRLDSKFIHIEQERILYNSACYKEVYALDVFKNKSLLPVNYYNYRKGLNFNDESLLALVPEYARFLHSFIVNETNNTLAKNEDYVLHQINTCIKYISNQKILDYLLINESELILADSKQFEKAYELFMANCRSERYRESATKKFQIYQNSKKGIPSPKFINYENYAGGTTSLEDLKGKFVYIDIWATWCGPCKIEIPALKKLEREYLGKNIEFLSISIDEEKNKEIWKRMIQEEQLKGIQLFADKNWKSQFLIDYGISGIPRFILIDTEGNIIDANAPRPSDPELDKLLKSFM